MNLETNKHLQFFL